jgi:uncharacterized protein (TIGR02145 family)
MNEIVIGLQVWSDTNLNVDCFNNGDKIPEAKTPEEWKSFGENQQAAWCYYDFDAKNEPIYGKLYNWYVVNDSRGIAPEGFKIPSALDFKKLIGIYNGDVTKLKSEYSWDYSDDYPQYLGTANGDNESGFNCFPGGGCMYNGVFVNKGYNSYYWNLNELSSSEYNRFSSDENFLGTLYDFNFIKNDEKKYHTNEIIIFNIPNYLDFDYECGLPIEITYFKSARKENGFSVRCLKNDSSIHISIDNIKSAVKLNFELFKNLDDVYRNNREIIFEAIENNSRGNQILKYISNDLRNDFEIVIKAVIKNGLELEFASNELKNDREVVFQAVKKYHLGNATPLKFASDKLRNDREIVLEAVKKNENGGVLEFASDELKNDREIVFEAVKKNHKGFPTALKFASDELRNDREIVLEAVKKNGAALEFVSDELKNDREIVLEAVKIFGEAIEFASDELNNNREFIFAAIKKNGLILEYISYELKNDREIVFEAVKEDGEALEFASDEFKNDREIVYEAVKRNGWALKYASNQLKNDYEIALEAINNDFDNIGETFKFASDELKNNREFVLEALKDSGYLLEFASDELKNDREIVLEAVKSSGYALQFASDELKNDLTIALEAVKEDERSILFVGENIRDEIEEIINKNVNDDEWLFDEEE